MPLLQPTVSATVVGVMLPVTCRMLPCPQKLSTAPLTPLNAWLDRPPLTPAWHAPTAKFGKKRACHARFPGPLPPPEPPPLLALCSCCVVPLVKTPVAVNCRLPPGETVGADGDTVIDTSAAVTLTVKVLVDVLFDASRAVTVTVVGPCGKRLPDAGDALTAGCGSTRSLAVGRVKLTLAPCDDVAVAVTFCGLPRTGARVSRIVTGNEADPCVLCAPCAVQVTCVVPSG